MTDKTLRKLKRADLLEMLIEQGKEAERLRGQIEELNQKLADRQLVLDKAGTIAEASFALNGVLKAAEAAAQQYLDNLDGVIIRQKAACAREEDACRADCEKRRRETLRECTELQRKAEQQCELLRRETEQSCETLRKETGQECESLRSQTRQECESLRNQTKQECEALRSRTEQECREQRRAAQQECEALYRKTRQECGLLRQGTVSSDRARPLQAGEQI